MESSFIINEVCLSGASRNFSSLLKADRVSRMMMLMTTRTGSSDDTQEAATSQDGKKSRKVIRRYQVLATR